MDVYKDRDKYLLRSLQVTGRMENLIREMLAISRMEARFGRRSTASGLTLSALIERQLVLDAGLLEQRGQRLVHRADAGNHGDWRTRRCLGKAVGNLAVQRLALFARRGRDPRLVRHCCRGVPP